jgi:hypothetical protein
VTLNVPGHFVSEDSAPIATLAISHINLPRRKFELAIFGMQETITPAMESDCCGTPVPALEPPPAPTATEKAGACQAGCCGGQSVETRDAEPSIQKEPNEEKIEDDCCSAGKCVDDVAEEDSDAPDCCRGKANPCCDTSCLDRLALRECGMSAATSSDSTGKMKREVLWRDILVANSIQPVVNLLRARLATSTFSQHWTAMARRCGLWGASAGPLLLLARKLAAKYASDTHSTATSSPRNRLPDPFALCWILATPVAPLRRIKLRKIAFVSGKASKKAFNLPRSLL